MAISKDWTQEDSAENLSREQLEQLAKADSSMLVNYLGERTRFDHHRIRVMLDLGKREAERQLEAL